MSVNFSLKFQSCFYIFVCPLSNEMTKSQDKMEQRMVTIVNSVSLFLFPFFFVVSGNAGVMDLGNFSELIVEAESTYMKSLFSVPIQPSPSSPLQTKNHRERWAGEILKLQSTKKGKSSGVFIKLCFFGKLEIVLIYPLVMIHYVTTHFSLLFCLTLFSFPLKQGCVIHLSIACATFF